MTDNKSPISWKLRRKKENKESTGYKKSTGYKGWRENCDSSFRSRRDYDNFNQDNRKPRDSTSSYGTRDNRTPGDSTSGYVNHDNRKPRDSTSGYGNRDNRKPRDSTSSYGNRDNRTSGYSNFKTKKTKNRFRR